VNMPFGEFFTLTTHPRPGVTRRRVTVALAYGFPIMRTVNDPGITGA
jgi:hypothetical protein